MHVTAQLDYALRALAELARHDGELVKSEELAERHGLPLKFLTDILTRLVRAGLLNSLRGGGGGYWLAGPAAQTTIADVVAAFEGPPAGPPSLPPGRQSPFDAIWRELQMTYLEAAGRITLADLAEVIDRSSDGEPAQHGRGTSSSRAS